MHLTLLSEVILFKAVNIVSNFANEALLFQAVRIVSDIISETILFQDVSIVSDFVNEAILFSIQSIMCRVSFMSWGYVDNTDIIWFRNEVHFI